MRFLSEMDQFCGVICVAVGIGYGYFTVQCADDTGCHRLTIAECITDGDRCLSGFQIIRIAKCCNFDCI